MGNTKLVVMYYKKNLNVTAAKANFLTNKVEIL